MTSERVPLISGAEAFNLPAQRSPDEAAERPLQGGEISLFGSPPWGEPRALQAHGSGGLGSYRLIDTLCMWGDLNE